MKFSALVLSLALSTSAAFAPSASRASTVQRFSTPVEAPAAVEEESKPVATMEAEATPAPLMPELSLPVEAEEPVDKIMP